MGKMLTVEVDDEFAKQIDSVISSSKLYSSRSEFLKDSMRKNLSEMLGMSESLKKLRASTEELYRKVKARGGPRKISRKERDELAMQFAREKGLI